MFPILLYYITGNSDEPEQQQQQQQQQQQRQQQRQQQQLRQEGDHPGNWSGDSGARNVEGEAAKVRKSESGRRKVRKI